MVPKRRQFSLSIWGMAFGYFACYAPYSALIKVITTSDAPGRNHPVTGFEILPATILATIGVMLLIITVLGWWKYATLRTFGRVRIPCPAPPVVLSGLGTAAIIATTTLAYSFKGVSILFALLLLRGGVLIIAPVVDCALKRRVRWFSWFALALSLSSLAFVFVDVDNYKLTLMAGANLILYLSGYLVRLPCMTAVAKSNDSTQRSRYFVDEQIVAMAALLIVPGIIALVGSGDAAEQLRYGFTLAAGHKAALLPLIVGALYAALCTFGTLVYLDPRENTFCVPLNRCSSLLSGVVASYGLAWLAGHQIPSAMQLLGATMMFFAILFLSPLHHGRHAWQKIRAAYQLLDQPVESADTNLVPAVENRQS